MPDQTNCHMIATSRSTNNGGSGGALPEGWHHYQFWQKLLQRQTCSHLRGVPQVWCLSVNSRCFHVLIYNLQSPRSIAWENPGALGVQRLSREVYDRYLSVVDWFECARLTNEVFRDYQDQPRYPGRETPSSVMLWMCCEYGVPVGKLYYGPPSRHCWGPWNGHLSRGVDILVRVRLDVNAWE
jgi:hypothetical protein